MGKLALYIHTYVCAWSGGGIKLGAVGEMSLFWVGREMGDLRGWSGGEEGG